MSQFKLEGKHDVNDMVMVWCKQFLKYKGLENVWIDTLHTHDYNYPEERKMKRTKILKIGVFKTFKMGFLDVYSFEYEYESSYSGLSQFDNYEHTTIYVRPVVNEQIVEKCHNE